MADRRSVISQCPEDLGLSREQVEAGSSTTTGGGSAAAMRKKMAANLAMKWARATGDLQHSKDRRLAAFITRAGAVADVLLRERRLGSSGMKDLMRHAGQLKPHATPGQPGSLTASYMALDDSKLTAGRVVKDSMFASGSSSSSSSSLLIAYAPSDIHSHGLAGRGLLLVWDLSAASPAVSHALVLEGVPTCVAWGPGERNNHLIVCGTEEGAVCAWDLREPEEMHRAGGGGGFGKGGQEVEKAVEDEEDKIAPSIMKGRPFRRPSYCTEAFSEEFPEDAGSLVSLGVAVDTTSGAEEDVGTEDEDGRVGAGGARSGAGEGSSSGVSGGGGDFHLIALDCWGNVSTYLMSELSRREAVDVALTDMGLRFGSRIRLLKAAAYVRYGGGGGGGKSTRARTMTVQNRRGTAAEFFVASETGRVLRGARYGTPRPPRAFAVCDPLDAGRAAAIAPAAPAVSLSFNPFFPKIFLAAHTGGSAAMYSTDSSLALQRWEGITPGDVVAVRWSPARPSQFFVLDDRCYITVFDLLSKTPEDPVHVEQFGKKERIVSFELAKVGGGGGTGGGGGAQVESTYDKGQYLASLAYDDGRTDVHLLADVFSNCSADEMEQSRVLMNAPVSTSDSLAGQLRAM